MTLYILDATPTDSLLKKNQKKTAPADRVDHVQRLRVYIDDETGDYKYRFDSKEIVFRHPDDNVTFNLVNEIPNADAQIYKHVSNDDKSPTDAAAKVLVLHPLPAKPIPLKAQYKPSTSIRLKMATKNFGSHEMIHIGIIVEILAKGASEPKYLLCDPQVGNGPP